MITSVIIPCWIQDEETWKVTNDCIESFKQADGDKLELILIDNASRVGTGYMRSEASVYVRFPQNVGFTVAMNYGIKLATGDLIALANNDIRVPGNWDITCREILNSDVNKDYQIATIHPKMIGYDDSFVGAIGNFVATSGMERWCGNSFAVTSKEFLETMREEEKGKEPYPGLFDQNFGIGGGADDWCFYHRVRKLGKQCFTNRTVFQHKGSFSLQKLGNKRQEIVNQNNEYFFKKYGCTKEELLTREFPEQMKEDYYNVLKSL